MRVLDLFSGIGGFSLGLERAGHETIGFCEIEPFCRRVIAKHWPAVPCHNDVRELKGEPGSADIITGGFPCQDTSLAGKGAGLDGERSGLWGEFARIIGEIRPLYAIVENTPGLFSRGLGRVLGDLASIGYDAEWECLSACTFGATHTRERLFIVAYPAQERRRRQRGVFETAASLEAGGRYSEFLRPWSVEPKLPRVAYGVPDRTHRIAAIGNSIIPPAAEYIGRALSCRN